MKKRYWAAVLALFIAAALSVTGCENQTAPAANQPPAANAGADMTITLP